ncbi:hypothetical protein ACFSJY_18245 [Thalassotalea euphylliae]|uniref:hypothetical protein n=1 Tax=Thalassotalea euphylliae TaxID=1655234 RepID=UPI003627DB42
MLKIAKIIPKNFVLGFLLFASIYAFNLPIVGNSAYWSMALIWSLLLIFDGAATNFKLLLRQKFFYFPILVLTAALVSSIILPIVHNTSDFTMVKTWINNLLAYITIGILVSAFLTKKDDYESVFRILFIVFIIQVVIVWLMLAVAPLRDAIQSITKSAAAMARMETYGGARGLGFTSFVAFGFSVLMGLLALLMHYYFAVYKAQKHLPWKVILFYMAFIAGISAGRTSFAGLAMGFYFYWILLNRKQLFAGVGKSIIYSLILVSPVIIYIMSNPALADIVDQYYRYAFQFIYKYFYDGYVGKSSLDALESMYFPLTNEQIFWGDGRYTSSVGNYYMQTDAGYMRFILMLGLVPNIIIYAGFCWILLSYYIVNKEHVPAIGGLILLIGTLSFVYHYKGELIMYNVSYMKIIYFLFISISLITIKKKMKGLAKTH